MIKREKIHSSSILEGFYLNLWRKLWRNIQHKTISRVLFIEVKCWKFFRGRSIEQIIQQKLPELSSQCFKVVENKILLKTSHSYYYQIQLQLLLAEVEYCDFVLYSDIGKIYIEGIFKDKDLQYRIIEATRIFWSSVLIPEYFLMRIPRETSSFYFVISIFNFAIYFR